MYADIFHGFKRFFNDDIMAQKEFLNILALGLMPRKFDKYDNLDKIILEENQEVSEMYFIKEGIVGVAINAFANQSTASFYKICFK